MVAEVKVVVQQKKWYASKTMWFNIITMISLLGVVLTGVKLSVTHIELVGAIVAAANIALRLWFTGAPLTETAAAIAAPDKP